MGKQLTLEMIAQRTKSDKFASIKNLNLWGNDLDNVSVIKELPNLEVLSLSVNHIDTLKDFASCPHLTELYLRKNAIADLSEVQCLAGLKQLRVLWLWDNPCAETPNYRLIVLHFLPHLIKLDNTEVTSEERESAGHLSLEAGIPAPPVRETAAVPAPAPAPSKRKYDPPKESPAPAPLPAPVIEAAAERPLPALAKPSSSSAKRPARVEKREEPEKTTEKKPEPEQKNENILCAVLALLKELDPKSLELVKRDIDRKIASKKA